MKILVVDDSVSMRQMITIVLKAAGHEIVVAADGVDGLRQFDDSIEAVMTDYNMPTMGGIEFIRAIRTGQTNHRVPILMLTTESDNEKKNEGRDVGATAWITKPFNRDALLATLEKMTRTVEF